MRASRSGSGAVSWDSAAPQPVGDKAQARAATHPLVADRFKAAHREQPLERLAREEEVVIGYQLAPALPGDPKPQTIDRGCLNEHDPAGADQSPNRPDQLPGRIEVLDHVEHGHGVESTDGRDHVVHRAHKHVEPLGLSLRARRGVGLDAGDLEILARDAQERARGAADIQQRAGGQYAAHAGQTLAVRQHSPRVFSLIDLGVDNLELRHSGRQRARALDIQPAEREVGFAPPHIDQLANPAAHQRAVEPARPQQHLGILGPAQIAGPRNGRERR